MSHEIPEDLFYTESHEYLQVDNGTGRIGLTSYACSELNEIIYLDLPEEAAELRQSEPMGSVEAVKAVFDLNSPCSGEVIEINSEAVDNPQIVIDDPYDKGWLVKVKIGNPDELDALMTSDDYEKHCTKEAH
jgi:glycine cleavage system H protein